MKRLLLVVALLAALLLPRFAFSQQASLRVVKQYNLSAARVLPDPMRSRVYVASPSTNTVAVIDTTTLNLLANVAVGSQPNDLAISPDGAKLYIANYGSSIGAISVLDLNTLQTLPSLSLPTGIWSVAAGLGNRLYASSTGFSGKLYQLDATTGTVQATLASGYDTGLLRISPDLKTLYSSVIGYSPSALFSYNVSAAKATPLQSNTEAGTNASDLVVSHNGRFLCQPCGGGNAVSGYGTALFSASDINSYYGVFDVGAYPGKGTFNPTDTLFYESRSGLDESIEVFDTATFVQVQKLTLPNFLGASNDPSLTCIAMDNAGAYLFVGESDPYGDTPTYGLAALTLTGAAPGAAPSITSAATASATLGQPFRYQVTATNSPTAYSATNLPPGISLNAVTGLLSGTPLATGSYNVGLVAANGTGSGTATVTVNVSGDYQITSALTAMAQTGQPFSYQITSSNSPAVFKATGLPLGLSCDASSGIISGTPVLAGLYPVALSAVTGANQATATLALQVNFAVVAPVISGAASATVLGGRYFSYQIVASNAPTRYSIIGLPTGMNFDFNTGQFFGTLPAVENVTVYPLTFSAANAGGVGTANFTLTVLPSSVAVSIAATTSSVQTGSGEAGVFVISRSGSNLSADLTVSFTIKGTATNGVDYQLIKDSKKIKAGKSSVSIRILPIGDLGGEAKKVVKLALQPGSGYTMSDANQAKLKILSGE